jgi:urate oxidase
MTVRIAAASYGKRPIRLLRWTRTTDGDAVTEFTLSIDVSGELTESYAYGDNTGILPSDTLRRHALAAFGAQPAIPNGDLLATVGDHILAAADGLDSVSLATESRSWRRLGRHTFAAEGPRLITAATVTRQAPPVHAGGLRDVELLSTTGSSFTGFLRDPLTVQLDAVDRPLSGTLDADWTWAGAAQPTELIADALLAAFADRRSNAIQQLLTATARAVLDANAGLDRLQLRFDSLPITPLPAELAGAGFEIGAGPLGVTAVTLSRGQ